MKVGRVRIWVKGNPDNFVEGWLDDESPELSGGVGGWSEIARPRRGSLVEWQGTTLFVQNIPLLLDAHAKGGNVQGLVDRLESWGRPRARGANPPVLKVSGAGIDRTDLEWVLNGLVRGDGILDADGRLTRRAVNIELMQYEESAFLLPHLAPAARKFRVVRARRGDTLKKLAARHLGAAKRWPVLRRANPKLRDPNRVLKVGTRVRVPR